MEKARANARQGGPGRGQKSDTVDATRGQGGRGSRGGKTRGGSRGRGGRGGRGGGGRGGERVVLAWHDGDGEDDEEDEEALINGGAEQFMTDSDYERLELEIDDAVELSAMRAFAGTMIVDADDVTHKREKMVAAMGEKPKTQNKKKKDKKKKAEKEVEWVDIGEVEDGEEEEEQQVKPQEAEKTKAQKKKERKKNRASAAVAEKEEKAEAVPVDEGKSESVETAGKTKAKKNKQKNKKAVDEREVVEAETAAEGKKKKAKKTRQPLVEDAVPVEKAKPAKTAKPQKEEQVKTKAKTKSKPNAEATENQAPTKKAASKIKADDASAGEQLNKDGKGQKNARTRWEGTDKRTERENFYEDYSDRNAVMEALERGELYQGKLRINPQYKLRAFVTVAGIAVDILVDGVRDRNRGMDGDLVAVKLLDEDKWKPLNDKHKDDDEKKKKKKLEVEMNGPVPSGAVEDEETKIDSAAALHNLWRPTLDASRCFLPPSATSSSSTKPSPSALTTARSVFERSQVTKCRPTAKVVFIMASGNAQGFVGSLEPKTKPANENTALSAEDDYAYFNAEDPRIPRRIRIPRLQLPDQFVSHPLKYSQEMMCFCRITKWSVSHESPVGEFVKTLGEYTGIESGISAILTKHGLLQHTNDFRQEILDELDTKYGVGGEKWSIPDDEVAKRRDFRSVQIFSIDPYNARDLDDALHIRALDKAETQFEVGVHIADVTHFIEKSSFLDVEAQQRATSVYLANRVLPMLPRILCERLCSLQPQVDRLAFSVVWQMNRDGSLVEGCVPWFGKSIIRSCCKLDYGTAQRMLDGVVTKDKLDEWEEDRRPVEGDNADITPATVIQAVKYLWLVAKNRRATRFDTGSVTLQDIKLTFTLDAMGNPTSFGTYQLKNSNRLVEEYMLLANYLVAQRLLQARGPLAFIRRHPEPNEQALETTLSTLSENSIQIDGSSPKTLSESLDTVREARGAYDYGVIQNMITKPMKPAEYLVAGSAGNEAGWRHYALNIPYYTHFTSPIRRYADVAVHRLLQESIVDADTVTDRLEAAGDELTGLMDELQAVAGNCNEKKMTSKNAEKECDQVFLCAYVKHNGAVDVTGVVVSTGQRSFTVYVSELGLEHRIEVRDLGSVKWSWQEKTTTLSLVFGKTKRTRRKRVNKDVEEKDGEAVVAGEEAEEKEAEPAAAKPETPASAVETERVDLKFLTKLRLRMTTTDRMPLALKFNVVGPWKQ